jgi:putative transposase
MLPGPHRLCHRRTTTVHQGRNTGEASWLSLRVAHENEIQVFAAGGTNDHVHLLISLPRTISIAKAVQLLKSGSSKWIHESFQGSRTFAWQEGYGAFSVGISQRARTVKYIQAQVEHHKRISFDDELRKFLSIHGINEDFSRP